VDGERPVSQSLRVDPARIKIGDEPLLNYLKPVSIAFHKPPGYICSRSREREGHKIIYDLLPPHYISRKPAINVAGRLDKWASGLCVLTDDGQFAHQCLKRGHERHYLVQLFKDITDEQIAKLSSGEIMLPGEDKPLLPVEVSIQDNAKSVTLTMKEGRYHQIRRMMEYLGNSVDNIKRTQIAGIELGNLEVGQFRDLSQEELDSIASNKV